MPTLSQHRLIALALLLGSLIIILARPLTVIFHGVLAQSFTFPVAISRPSKRLVAAVEAHLSAKPKAAVIKEVMGVPLSSMWRSYAATFTGKTRCSGMPCAATLRVSIEPDGAELPVASTVQSESDGSYRFQVPFQALPNHQLDWKVTAVSSDLVTQEIHGRQILSDDSQIDVAQDIDLR